MTPASKERGNVMILEDFLILCIVAEPVKHVISLHGGQFDRQTEEAFRYLLEQ